MEDYRIYFTDFWGVLGHKRSLAGPGPKYKIMYFEKSI